jgi:hypothetical protein
LTQQPRKGKSHENYRYHAGLFFFLNFQKLKEFAAKPNKFFKR